MKLNEIKKLNESQFLTNDADIYDAAQNLELSNIQINDGIVDVDGAVDLTDLYLSSLPFKFGKINGSFDARYNNLKSFDGFPTEVRGYLDVDYCAMTSFEGCPRIIGGNFFSIQDTNIVSLEGIADCIDQLEGDLIISPERIKRGGLGLLQIEGLTSVGHIMRSVDAAYGWINIINKHLEGNRDIFECQEELLENGFEEYAIL